MRRLNAADDRWICIESEQNTFQIGALLLFEADADHPSAAFEDAVRSHLEARLPATPLAVRLATAPGHFDTGVWLAVDQLDLERQVHRVDTDAPLDRAAVNELVSAQVLVPWDRTLAPFHASVLDTLDPDVADEPVSGRLVGLILQTHHSVADGVGFQSVIEDLTDPDPGPHSASIPWHREAAPAAPIWIASSAARFAAAQARHISARRDRGRAARELASLRARPGARRARTPVVAGMAASGLERGYERMVLPLSGLRTVGRALGGTVNDTLMTVVAGALRRLLEQRGVLDALGSEPLVALVPRSTRTDADGRYGNHLTMMLPQLATHVAEPRERFRLIHGAMRAEIARSELAQRLAGPEDRPFAARDRRRRTEAGTAAGNVSISNVPGPAEPRFLAGYRMVANYPVPNVVEGQFLNVTLRRYQDALHLGLMSDLEMMGEPATLVPLIEAEYEALCRVVW